MISLFAVSAWAADVSVTEKFTRVVQTGSSGANGSNWTGDICGWETKFARRGSNDKLNGNQCTWITLNGSDIRGYIKTTNLEGGIKAVSFKYGQFGAEATTVLKWHVSTEGISTTSDIIERDGDLGGNTGTDGDSYSHQFLCKENAQLKILNMSEMDNGNMPASGKARLLVNNITITPYLLYRNKDVTVGLKQRGYVNNGSQDFINNTGSEGSIAFSSSNENVATVDPETGVVTPVGVGDAVITATWSEGASTTYTLHVVDGIIAENFSKVVQTGQTAGATWHGDLFDWTVANVRRGVEDTLGLVPRIQATAMRSNAGSTIISANAIEGGVKHLAFDWRQWASATSPLTFNAYYSADTENWGDAVATQAEDAVKASTSHVFDAAIDDGAKGNAYLKIEYTSGAGVAVIGALKITPWLLYTTKEATLDTRVNLTYTNSGLINNTGATPTYEIAPANAAVSINGDGQVAVEDGADVNGDFTVTASWNAVTTTYTLHILSRSTANISFAQEAVRIGLDGSVDNALNKDGHDGTAEYSSDNDAVATVDAASGVVTLQGGVGQVKISVSIPQTTNYKAASASYNLYVRDNGARIEDYSNVPTGGAVGDAGADWPGVYFDWYAEGAIRHKAGDTIGNAIKVWIGTKSTENANPVTKTGVLASKEEVEGGIKHLSFYWRQWATESNRKLRMAVFAGETRKAFMEREPDNLGAGPGHEHYLFGANDVMRGNEVLSIKNESYTNGTFDGTIADDASGSRSRVIIDDIYITPYLLYTTKERTLDMKSANSCTYTPEINNIESGSITYSLEDNDDEASIDAESGEVTGIKAGEVTVKAKWSEGAFTTYTLTILAKSVAEASYPNAIVRIGLDEAVDNALAYTAGYDGTIVYASSNTAVADFEAGVLVIKGVGQTTITATLPETENYLAAEASYNLYVRDNGARKEAFGEVHIGDGVVGADAKPWAGDLFPWTAQYSIRKNANDTIWGATKGVWIGTGSDAGGPGVLNTTDEIEGGIKYLSFYWKQWANESGKTLRIAAFDGDTRKGFMEYVPSGASTHEKFLLGINDVMRGNRKLYIKNESYTGTSFDPGNITTSNSRIILDTIYITPYLLYTTKEYELDLRIATTYTNAGLIDNTESGTITYTLEDNDEEATIDEESGEVTGLKAGQVTVKATWSEGVFTTYTLNIISITETEASYANAEIHATLGETIPANALNVTDGYDGEISYASSVPAVADFENGVLTLKAPGQTKITATLPETSNYTAATASYILTVSYSNYESFNPNTTSSTYAKPEENAQGDMCKWYAYIGGVQTPNYFSSNTITTRAQRTNESNQGYVKSAKLSGGISALAFNYSMMFADNDIENWDIRVYVNDRLVGQLTNEEGGDLEGINGRTLNPMRTKVITGIDEPGMFVIRFENHSTVKSNVEYESGNKGRFAIDNVSWENFDGPIVLNESTDNSSVIVANSGATVDVAITRSAMVADVWNTLCLPFAISKASDLDDAEVKEMTGVAMVGDVLEIYFSDITGDELVAGKPYLVKPASNKDISRTYNGKQIASIASPVVLGDVTMQGLFSPMNVTKDDYNTLFVGNPDGEGNNLFYPQADGQLRGLRAYFKLGGAALPAPRRARYVINQTEVVTDIESIQNSEIRIQKVIRDGQLYIMYNGVMYNVQGARVQ